ncbi:hypothetical protein AAA531_33540, partial [Pseudomonas aeruginosa]
LVALEGVQSRATLAANLCPDRVVPASDPTPLATLGQQLVRLGQAMQNPNTKLGELTELVQACGVDLRICDTNKENRS